ncbi:MAG: hypothetical protein HQK95_00345 [Nitrospirae bacterium]|nr:hypothetical protein [Nitrospirota bacterium]
MKDELHTQLICKGFCEFYSEGKDSMLCKAYEAVRDAIPVERLQEILEKSQTTSPTFAFDTFIRGHICAECDFRVDGCDYADGLNSPPCGGYKVIELLKERGIA